MPTRTAGILLFTLLCMTAGICASPQEDDPPTTPVKDDPASKEPAQVGWQSIFWGTFALAVHAMSIPSFLDGRLLQNDVLLYPLRSSPLVCMVDTLDLLARLSALVVIKKHSLEEAASVLPIHYLRFIREKSAIQKHPVVSAIWFLATATQAIKIFGFQGEGLWWAKTATGMYIGSYLILVWISHLFRSPPTTILNLEHLLAETHNQSLIRDNSTFTVHVVLITYALFRIAHIPGVGEGCQNSQNGFFRAMCVVTLLLVAIFSYLCGMVIASSLLAYAIIRIGHQERLPVGSTYHSKVEIATIFLVIAVLSIAFFLPTDNSFWVLVVGNVIFQGGVMLLLGWIGLGLLLSAADWGLSKIVSVNGLGLTELTASEYLAVSFAIINAIVLGLFCAFAYDPTGTIKPGWTEKLG